MSDPCVRDAELTGASVVIAAAAEGLHDVFHERDRLPDDLQPGQVKSHGHERPLPQENKVSRGNVPGICGVLQQDMPLAGIESKQSEPGLRVPGVSHDGEQHGLPIGKPGWQTVAILLTLGVGLGQDLGLPALSRYP